MSEPIRITDPRDERLDAYRNLNRSDARGHGPIIAEGPLVIPRLLASRYPVESIIGFQPKLATLLDNLEAIAAHVSTQPPALSPAGSIADVAASLPDAMTPQQLSRLADQLARVAVWEVPREVLAEVAGFDVHRGLLAAATRIPAQPVEEVLATATRLVILEGVNDHENIGAIFRNAAGLGVDGVLFGAATADPLYRRVVRVSMGHVLRLPFAFLPVTPTTWQRSLEMVKAAGFQVVAMTPAPDAVHLATALDPTRKTALLVGAEGPGLTIHAQRAADVRAKIPMLPGTDSLNVATAAAIGMYEAARRS